MNCDTQENKEEQRHCGFCQTAYVGSRHVCFEDFYKDVLSDPHSVFMYIQRNWNREKRNAIAAMFRNEKAIRKNRIYGE